MAVMEPTILKVKLADLTLYPGNPRKGNVEAIADSIKQNGQYVPLTVQKSTGYVLRGNHTLRALRKLKRKTCEVVYVNVDDEQAKRIVLADNRTAELGSYDMKALMDLINSLDEPAKGTGYSDSDITNLAAAVAERDSELINDVIHNSAPVMIEDDDDDRTFSERLSDQRDAILSSSALAGDEEAKAMMEGTDVTQKGIATAQTLLHAEIEAKVDAMTNQFFSSSNAWGIYDIRPDMLVDRLPDPIDTWAGEETTPDDGKTHWLLNWGSVSSKGIPWDRTVLGFYSHDARWAGWYENPGFLIGKVVSQGVTMSFQPESSATFGYPRFFLLQSTWDSNFLTRIMQECGIRIIPTIRVTDHESIPITTLGMPRKAPIVAIQSQQKGGNEGIDTDKIGWHTVVRAAVKELDPQSLVVYGGPPAHKMIEKAKLPKDLPVTFIENFSKKRNDFLKPWHEERRKHDNLVKDAKKKLAGEEPPPDEAAT